MRAPMTMAGAKRLRAELEELKSVKRPKVIADIAEARAHGDLKENAEYHAAREKQGFIEGRIKELEGVLSLAEVIDPTKLSGGVKFGATIVVVDEDSDEGWGADVAAPAAAFDEVQADAQPAQANRGKLSANDRPAISRGLAAVR